uniref:HORMA domain-containing protein n=1 Tax=Canis lupus familiaris TaxID=9615 RepID=A0A8I3P4A2_CANLF
PRLPTAPARGAPSGERGDWRWAGREARRACAKAPGSSVVTFQTTGGNRWRPCGRRLVCRAAARSLVPRPGRGAAALPRAEAEIVAQFFYWLYKCSVQKLVVFISNIESGEVLERWKFDIECDKTAKDDSFFGSTPREKSQKAIQDEILSVIQQITATVTFLPLLEVSCKYCMTSRWFRFLVERLSYYFKN